MLGLGLSNSRGGAVSSFVPDAAAEALFARMSVQPLIGYKMLANQLIIFLKNSENWVNGAMWNRIDQLLVFSGANNMTDALLNWKGASFNGLNVGARLTAAGVLTGYAAGQYVNTVYNASTNRTNLQLTSGSFHYGVGRVGSNLSYDFGSFSSSNFTGFTQQVLPSLNAFGGIGNTLISLGAGTLQRTNISLNRTGTSLSLHKNGAAINTVTVTPQSFANRSIFLGGYNEGVITRLNYQIYSHYMVADYLTPAESVTLNTLLTNFKNNAQQYTGAIHRQLVCDGNSLTAGIGATNATFSWPSVIKPLLDSTWEVINLGIGSQRTVTMTANAPEKVDANLYNQYNTENICVAWEIINDLLVVSKEQAMDNFIAYCQARKAVGHKVIVVTLIDHPTISQVSLDYCNGRLRSEYLTFADGICDVAADVRFQDCTNLTYYNADQIHLNDNGYSIVAGLMATVVLSI